MMKNVFYFTLKALFVLKLFRLLYRRFGHVEKRLDQKDKLIPKYMTSQPGKQIIAMHILPNISRSKDDQRMKFGQLLQNMRNIFLEKSYTKCGGEFSRRFSEIKKLRISLDQQSKVLYSLFLLYVKLQGYRNILKLSCITLAFTSCKAILKNKKLDFGQKMFLLLYSTN